MKRYFFVASLISLFAAAPLWSQNLAYPRAPFIIPVPTQTLAFTGGSVWTSQSTGTCIWYFPVLADLPLSALFAPDTPGGAPVIDKEHAYFIWVSDWMIQAPYVYENPGLGEMSQKANSPVSLANVPAGSAAIYYRSDPLARDFSKLTDRSTWGKPIATFRRGAGLFQSPDNFEVSDRFFFSAQLVTSRSVNLPGRIFDFRNVMPYGMNCYEFGQNSSTTETGACTTMTF